MDRRAVLIAGPTASGKSARALRTAQRNGGVIINADSMQVYDVLDVLSARPQPAELEQAEHFLYGFVPPQRRFSAGAFMDAVQDLLSRGELAGRTLIFVGGTGLYFQCLTDGFMAVPPVPAALVARIEKQVLPLSRSERKDLLGRCDPLMAERLREPDRQRLVRALSVLEATGKSLACWQDQEQKGVLDGFRLEKMVLNPDREVLNGRIVRRFETMLETGGVEEVRELLALDLDPSLPVMKAIGVREISDMLAGRISRNEAVERAVIATRQYAKRQRTWFRGRMKDWTWTT